MAYTRIRETNNRFAPNVRLWTSNTVKPKWTLFGESKGYSKNLGTHRVIYDNKTRRPLPGQVVNNPCCMYRIKGESHCSDLVMISPYPTYASTPHRRYSGDWVSGCAELVSQQWPQSPIDIDRRVQDYCIQKAMAQINEPPVDMGIFFAELGKTARMLVNPFKSLSSILNSVVRRGAANKVVYGSRTFKAREDFDRINDAFLTYRYGISPLLRDIDGLIKDYENKVNRPISRIDRSSGGMSVQKTDTLTRSPTAFFDGIGWFNLQWNKRVSVRTYATGAAYWIRKTPKSGYGGSFNDLASFLWEIIPYSFVVDQVFKVGNWLRAIQPNESVTYAGNYVSLKTVIETQLIHVGGYERSVGYNVPGTGSSVTVVEERLVRIPNTNIPVTPVYMGPRLSLYDTISDLSLIWQKMPKLKRY